MVPCLICGSPCQLNERRLPVDVVLCPSCGDASVRAVLRENPRFREALASVLHRPLRDCPVDSDEGADRARRDFEAEAAVMPGQVLGDCRKALGELEDEMEGLLDLYPTLFPSKRG